MKYRYKKAAIHVLALTLLAPLVGIGTPALAAMKVLKERRKRTTNAREKANVPTNKTKYIEVYESGLDDRAKKALMPGPNQPVN